MRRLYSTYEGVPVVGDDFTFKVKDVRDGCTYDSKRVEEDGCTFMGEGCKDCYTYNGMRVVGDGAADPLDLHQNQNKRHHSQRPRQHHKGPEKSISIKIKIKTLCRDSLLLTVSLLYIT
jgi:hypothetical protein